MPTGVNEVTEFEDARYVSTSEGITRILQLPLQSRSPAVQRLQIHLPFENTVVYPENADLAQVLQGIASRSTLTAFFELNAGPIPPVDGDGRSLLYKGEYIRFFCYHTRAGVLAFRYRVELK